MSDFSNDMPPANITIVNREKTKKQFRNSIGNMNMSLQIINNIKALPVMAQEKNVRYRSKSKY